MPRLTWSKQPSEKGLAAIGQSPRGLLGKIDGEIVCRVMPKTNWPAREVVGWYWYGWGKNSASDDKYYADMQSAKDNAVAYYKGVR